MLLFTSKVPWRNEMDGMNLPRHRSRLGNIAIDRIASLVVRTPSAPVRVDGRPWDGSPIADVAFAMVLNDNIVIQQQRVARACVDAGLSVAFINIDMGQEWAPRRSDYSDLGGPIVDLPLGTWRKGLMSFPGPFILLGKAAKLLAVLPGSSFGILAVPIDYWGECRLLCYWARRVGVTSVVLQEGMAAILDADHPYEESAERQPWHRALGTWLARRVPHDLFRRWVLYSYADFFCAYGNAAKDALAHFRADKDTTFVVGNPGLDHVTEFPSLVPVGDGRRTILYAHQGIASSTVEESFCNDLARICCDENDDRLIIKLHPRSEWTVQGMWQRVTATEKRASLLEIVKEGDSNVMLDDADLLVTVNSTTAYHALVRGIPVITVEYLGKGLGEFDAARYGGALAVGEPDDLRRAVFDATRNEQVRRQLHEGARRVIERHLYKLDGRASERIAHVLIELTQGKMLCPEERA